MSCPAYLSFTLCSCHLHLPCSKLNYSSLVPHKVYRQDYICPLSSMLIILSLALVIYIFFAMVVVQSLNLVCSCDPMDCSLPGSSIHGIFQVRILEWVAMPSSRGSSQPKDQTMSTTFNLNWQAGSLPLAPPGKPILKWVSYPAPSHHTVTMRCPIKARRWYLYYFLWVYFSNNMCVL